MISASVSQMVLQPESKGKGYALLCCSLLLQLLFALPLLADLTVFAPGEKLTNAGQKCMLFFTRKDGKNVMCEKWVCLYVCVSVPVLEELWEGGLWEVETSNSAWRREKLPNPLECRPFYGLIPCECPRNSIMFPMVSPALIPCILFICFIHLLSPLYSPLLRASTTVAFRATGASR